MVRVIFMFAQVNRILILLVHAAIAGADQDLAHWGSDFASEPLDKEMLNGKR
jgi:hypothetical protein